MKHLTLIALTLMFNSDLFAEPELTGTPGELTGYLQDIPQTVRITGKAEKKIPADRAIIHLNVTTEGRSLAEALSENRTLRAEITKNLLSTGLSTNHIRAAQFSSTPESGFFSDKVRKYTVKNGMKITVTNEDEFRSVAELIDAKEKVSYQKTEFELSTKKETERQLLAEACRDAVAKKALYETELLVTLTPVRFYDGTVANTQPRTQSLRMKKDAYSSFSLSESDSYSPPVQFDEMKFHATLAIDYRLQTN